jgi:hypothetical protein
MVLERETGLEPATFGFPVGRVRLCLLAGAKTRHLWLSLSRAGPSSNPPFRVID